MTKHTKKSEKKQKNLNFLLNGQNPLFQSFPTFGGMIGQIILFLNFLGYIIFQLETKIILGILWSKPYFKHFIQRLNPGENPKIANTQKALDRI